MSVIPKAEITAVRFMVTCDSCKHGELYPKMNPDEDRTPKPGEYWDCPRCGYANKIPKTMRFTNIEQKATA